MQIAQYVKINNFIFNFCCICENISLKLHVQNVNTHTNVVTEEKHTNLTEEAAEKTEQQSGNSRFFAGCVELAKAVLVEIKDDDDRKVRKHKRISYVLRKFFDKGTRTQSKNYSAITKHHQKVKFRQYISTVPHMLSLFFGLCCSSPLYIFDAIFGNSSNRIFSI